MARFTMEEAQAIVCIQQLINDWANELDVHNGLQNMGDILTNDCVYQVGGVDRQGRAEVLKFYQDRFARLSAEPGGVPFHRHTLSNLRTTFRSADSAAITFSLVYYSAAGMASGQDHADPALVARLGASGLGAMWRTAPWSSLWSALGSHFRDPRLRQLFARYATYVGSSPLAAPATLMLIAHVEQQGVWLVEGGMAGIAATASRNRCVCSSIEPLSSSEEWKCVNAPAGGQAVNTSARDPMSS